ncbi:MAG TPA: hypothetical protein VNS53_01580 [Sphingomicrobium sp.]|nr:hypothetical protein [Sphingomicrobium sp.]
MTMFNKFLAGGAGLAALAAAVPAAAQYYPSYGYGNAYGYGAVSTQAAVNQCTAAVQNRLYSRQGLSGIVSSLFGLSGTSGRVLSVTSVDPNRSTIRIRGTATSGRYSYNPYGYGYYGSVAAGYVPDLRYKCDVDYRGYVRDVDITRR